MSNVIGLDIGSKIIGLSIAYWPDGLARPLAAIENNQLVLAKLGQIIEAHEVSHLVVGRPLNMAGQETQQTKEIKDFVDKFLVKLNLPIHYMDESVTSVLAEKQLAKTRKGYTKADIDSYSAVIILNDFLSEHLIKKS